MEPPVDLVIDGFVDGRASRCAGRNVGLPGPPPRC